MNTTDADDDLRQALQTIDPQAGAGPDEQTIDRVWDRLLTTDESTKPRRRWLELTLAACLGAALVGGVATVAGQYTPSGGSDSSVMAVQEPSARMDAPAAESAGDSAQTSVPESTLARDASAVVAADDVRGARDEFVAAVLALNGRVTSETVTTEPGDSPMPATDIAVYPPMSLSPGISLSVEVPADAYDEAVAAIAPLGEVQQFTQSSVELGAQYSEGKARIAALKASLSTLQNLMDQAQSISDVIALEEAISQRQSDLDALSSQQNYLEGQIAQARISLQLLTPADASALYDTSPTIWQQIGDALATGWAWLGTVLVWTSPVWVLGGLWWLRRRRRV